MRLEVSIQGPALASAACKKALDYAAGRSQGGRADEKPVSILEHADVRWMLFIKTEVADMVFLWQESKRAMGRFYAEYLMPGCPLLLERINKGAGPLDSITSDALAG